ALLATATLGNISNTGGALAIGGNSTFTAGGAVNINNAVNAGGAFNSTGTTFNNTATINATGITINHTNNVTINAALTSGTGAVDIDAGGTLGLFSTINTTTGNVTLDSAGLTTVTGPGDIVTTTGDVSFGGALPGALTTSGDVTTGGGNVMFGNAVTLGANVAVDTGAGGGNIVFANTLDGTQNLYLTAGTGDVTFTGAVGAGTVLGDLTVNSSATLTAAAINAAKIDIRGNTAVNLNGNVNATNTFTSRGGNFNLPGGVTINTNNTNLLVANGGGVNVAGTLNAGSATAAFGSLDWASSRTGATIGGGGTVIGNTIIIGGNTVGTVAAPGAWVLQVQPGSASSIVFNLGQVAGVSGNVNPIGFAGANVSLDQINADGTLTIGTVTFNANTIDFGSLLTLSAQQEKIEKLLRAAATAEFFMKAPLWIDILMEEDEEEECEPDDEECLKRKRERETSWLAPDYLRPSRLGVYRPTLLYEETRAGDLVIQLSSLR
ncbi:MAG: hypothetical protein DRP09_17875, partial [Candidatus Thorarchaeota archaeon]